MLTFVQLNIIFKNTYYSVCYCGDNGQYTSGDCSFSNKYHMEWTRGCSSGGVAQIAGSYLAVYTSYTASTSNQISNTDIYLFHTLIHSRAGTLRSFRKNARLKCDKYLQVKKTNRVFRHQQCIIAYMRVCCCNRDVKSSRSKLNRFQICLKFVCESYNIGKQW